MKYYYSISNVNEILVAPFTIHIYATIIIVHLNNYSNYNLVRIKTARQ
jgi:hypothetical protein